MNTLPTAGTTPVPPLRRAGVVAFILLLSAVLAAQAPLRGRVTDTEGSPLPFATVYVKGTTHGVSANEEGRYRIELKPGTHELVFQYVGFAARTVTVQMGDAPKELDVALQSAGVELAVVEVVAGEDPAYPIIRKAIAKRESHRRKIKGYTCRAYIKGGVRLLNVPDSLMGNPLRSRLGADSSGYLYLSESEADIAVELPDKRKEVMIASRVSGNANGFSFNRFGILDFLDERVNIGRPLVNPVSDNALDYYRYRLLQTYTDEEGREIHQILVRPRRSEDPAFSGTIYILGDEYRYHSLDLVATRGNTKVDLIDTFEVQQSFFPVGGAWPLLQQSLRFRASVLGIQIAGNFTAVTSGYAINPEFPSGFFSKEIMKVEEEANKKDPAYWERTRPVPLTPEEADDYVRKDSLAVIRESREYLDSLDRVRNRLKPLNLVLGYTYNQTWHKRSWTLAPRTDWFNAVQGFTLGASARFAQEWRDKPGRELRLGASYLYGFGDGGHRYGTTGRWQGNAVMRPYVEWEAGDAVLNLNPESTFPRSYDALLVLWAKDGRIRYYESRYARLRWGTDFLVGWRGSLGLGYEERRPLVNRTEFAFRDLEHPHIPNDDLENPALSNRLGPNDRVILDAALSWRPGVRYITYPDRRFLTGSDYPRMTLTYRGGLDPAGRRAAFHRLSLRLAKNDQARSLYGNWSYNVEAGHFLLSPERFHDYRQFTGNDAVAIAENDSPEGFRALPIYSWGTAGTWFQMQNLWDDNSYVFDKIPGVRKLGLSLLLGYNHLWTTERGHWSEISLGVGRLGFKLLRPFNAHTVLLLDNGRYQGVEFRVGIKALPFLPGR